LSSQPLLQYWTAGTVEAPLALMGAMALWAVLESCGAAFAMFLNGVHVIRPQVVVVVLFCVLVLPLKVVGIHQIGLIAIPLAAVLVYAATHLYFYGLVYYSRIRSIVATAD
jgi:hypothetical protein